MSKVKKGLVLLAIIWASNAAGANGYRMGKLVAVVSRSVASAAQGL